MVMNFKRTFASLLFLLGCGGVAFGQTQTAEVFGSNPADGYISPTAYANAHFGFVLKIPQDKRLHPLALGVAGMIFGMQSNERDIAMLTIDAKAGNTDAKKTIAIAGHPVHTTIAGKDFWKTSQTKNTAVGKSTETTYACVLKGQVVRFILVSFYHSELAKQWKASIEGMQIIDPMQAKDAAGADALSYVELTSGKHLPPARSSSVATNIDPGKLNGTTYTNTQFGLSYEIPTGWTRVDKQTEDQAFDAGHRAAFGGGPAKQKEQEEMERCSRTLLFATQYPEGTAAGGQNALLVLRVFNPGCILQSPPFPASVEDKQGISFWTSMLGKFGPQFGTTLFQSKNEQGYVSMQGKHLVLKEGLDVQTTIGGRQTTTYCSFFMTKISGYLLMWVYQAPDRASLDALNKRALSITDAAP